LNFLGFQTLANVDLYLTSPPGWLCLTTCAHLYILAPLYVLLIISITMSFTRLGHLVGTLLGPAVIYNVLSLAIVQYAGDIPSPDFGLWLIFHVDDLICGLLIWLMFKGKVDTVRILVNTPKKVKPL